MAESGHKTKYRPGVSVTARPESWLFGGPIGPLNGQNVKFGKKVEMLCVCFACAKPQKAQSKPTNTVEAFMLLTARCTGYCACVACV